MDKVYVKFTPRQLETIGWLFEGSNNKDIATEMNISVATVKKTVSDICNITGMESRLQLVLFCLRNNVYQISDSEIGRRYMKFAMTPEQFNKIESIVSTDKSAKLAPVTPTTGTITTSDVELSYNYDGTASLDVEIVQRIGFFARHASDDTIFQHVNKLLSTVT